MELTKKELQKLDRIERLNIVNGLTGAKPANLIGTKGQHGENLAIFSSVVHLGSNPALLGMITRPVAEVPRHTFTHIIETEEYTINSVPAPLHKNAHYTSAKFKEQVSEFTKCNFTPEYKLDFKVPFVKESTIQLYMKLEEVIDIKINDTKLVIGSIEYLAIEDDGIEEGMLNLEKLNVAAISGLNSYYKLNKLATHPFARPEETPSF